MLSSTPFALASRRRQRLGGRRNPRSPRNLRSCVTLGPSSLRRRWPVRPCLPSLRAPGPVGGLAAARISAREQPTDSPRTPSFAWSMLRRLSHAEARRKAESERSGSARDARVGREVRSGTSRGEVVRTSLAVALAIREQLAAHARGGGVPRPASPGARGLRPPGRLVDPDLHARAVRAVPRRRTRPAPERLSAPQATRHRRTRCIDAARLIACAAAAGNSAATRSRSHLWATSSWRDAENSAPKRTSGSRAAAGTSPPVRGGVLAEVGCAVSHHHVGAAASASAVWKHGVRYHPARVAEARQSVADHPARQRARGPPARGGRPDSARASAAPARVRPRSPPRTDRGTAGAASGRRARRTRPRAPGRPRRVDQVLDRVADHHRHQVDLPGPRSPAPPAAAAAPPARRSRRR